MRTQIGSHSFLWESYMRGFVRVSSRRRHLKILYNLATSSIALFAPFVRLLGICVSGVDLELKFHVCNQFLHHLQQILPVKFPHPSYNNQGPASIAYQAATGLADLHRRVILEIVIFLLGIAPEHNAGVCSCPLS